MAAAGAPPRGPTLAAAARGAAFLGLWVVLAGPAPDGLVVGLLAAGFATWASLRLMPPLPWRPRPGALLLLVLRFPWQALRAGTEVALLALDPRRRPHPGMLAWTPRLKAGRAQDAFLAYASLLPGTLPAGPLDGGAIAIHALDSRTPVGEAMTQEEARFAQAIGADG
ncbi:Na+/H+ antiporter subunit E [Roseomonas eburnea]|uniref:Na+/H+ antiporter subunit E n=1 Tax=Neoroseomonas eburnea TaxID=1346889 RepID=A0A9X9XG55_9PROT|nr:Na+/H+ antiporter subunit E [Neoroseomonas eburnea]MBR0682691.1 Na+/H+ antiporter subunit E [Neoroseomonas eburnea]